MPPAALHYKANFATNAVKKKLNPAHDFSLWHFLEETFENLTHLDSRLIRSFWYSLAKPGFLAGEFMAGRRTRYMKPIPFFILVGVLFYFFFPTASSFYSNPGDLNHGYKNGVWQANSFQVNTPDIIAQRAAKLNLDPETFVKNAGRELAAPRSKTFLFVLIPFWGAIIWLFFRRKQPWVVPHLVFALYGLVFFVLFDLLSLLVAVYVLKFNALGDNYTLYVLSGMMLWCILAVKTTFHLRWGPAVVKGFAVALAFFILLNFYRQAITIWSLLSY